MRVFPALLFWICAIPLLLLPDESPAKFGSLKHAAGMAFGDLAAVYSEIGLAIVNLFRKAELSFSNLLDK